MLAGRKLLLADDSITIQKVVALTFADEGVSVVCVNNGREAVARLEEFLPDIVLADVFMPELNGYEVCEHIKQNAKLKHIPVMLLIGSFEPFDEEEARRVGANDTLTKPFQSIRRLVERVGLLTSNPPSEELIPTAELPKPHEPEAEMLSTAELELTTADTRPLPPELHHVVAEAVATQANQQGEQPAADAQAAEVMMESVETETVSQVSQRFDDGAGEVLLDLGNLSLAHGALDDDFVLDIDLDELPEPSPLEPAFPAAAFRSRDAWSSARVTPSYASASLSAATVGTAPAQTYERVMDEPLEEAASQATRKAQAVASPVAQVETNIGAPAQTSAAPSAAPSEVSLQQLSPEMIDAIARRAVEQLSEKVVEGIAWEVVPQLAELLIKRQLEEKNS